MARHPNQKLKIIYVLKILLENTNDENEDVNECSNGITMQEIISKLRLNGIDAERKSVADDMDALRELGFEIMREQKNHNSYYHIVTRPYNFQLVELKLLIDSVQCNKFISVRKSRELIAKIEKIASKKQGEYLKRQVYMNGRVKSDNPHNIYIPVDKIHRAISTDSQLTFQYCQWTLSKKLKPRHSDDYYYTVSPWAVFFDDGNYYLIAYDDMEENPKNKVKHFRVDKIINADLVANSHRNGRDIFEVQEHGLSKNKDMSEYVKTIFNAYGGEERTVTLYCKNDCIGIIIDRFGRDVTIKRDTDGQHFTVDVKIAKSLHFYHWVMEMGGGIEIVSPDDVVQEVRAEAIRLYELYVSKYSAADSCAAESESNTQ